MNIHFFLWLTIATVTAFIELGHPGLFYFLSCSIAGVIAAGSSFFIDTFELQVLLFFIATVGSVYLLRHSILRKIVGTHTHYQSNVQALQGKQGYVIKTIAPENPGMVKIGGELWMARAIPDTQIIQDGALIEVIQVVGAHVRVKKIS